MKKMFAASAAVFCLAAAAAVGVAADTASDPLAALRAGRKDFEASCSRCHSLDRVLAKKLDRAGWEQLVGAMTARGAALEPAQRSLILDYLVVKSAFETKCSSCHAVSNALAAKRTRQAWEATVKRMAEKSPPAFSAEEISLITAYLTLVVGAE